MSYLLGTPCDLAILGRQKCFKEMEGVTIVCKELWLRQKEQRVPNSSYHVAQFFWAVS